MIFYKKNKLLWCCQGDVSRETESLAAAAFVEALWAILFEVNTGGEERDEF